MIQRKWHSQTIEQVMRITKSSAHGLKQAEAQARLKKFGLNELPQQKPYSKLRLFLIQFQNPLIYIILGAIVVSIVLKHYSDSIFITLVLMTNTLVGFFQENKANNALNNLKKLVRINTRAIRDGNEKELDSRQLVIGDIVVLHSGDKIPADCRIIEVRALKVNESSLTGESESVVKNMAKLAAKTELADRTNMVFMGTIVEEGWAKALVVCTGLSTEIGEIVTMLSQTEESATPLQLQMNKLAKLTAMFILAIILIILTIGLLRFESTSDILLAALSLAVSAIPSGLLPAITLILVLGMHRILKQRGLVRKLVSTETLGSVTVICTDKTGTLTEGKMAVTHLLTASNEISGSALTEFRLDSSEPKSESIKQLAKILMLNSDAFLENPEEAPEKWIIRGRITEQALLRLGSRIGFNKKALDQEHLLLDKVYFSSEIKYSAALRQTGDNNSGLFVVGAPESIIHKSIDAQNSHGENFQADSEEFNKLITQVEELSKQGLRIIAVAHRSLPLRPKYRNLQTMVTDLTLVGLVALEDPIRAGVADEVKITKRAGIRTVVVTGDHKLTAQAVAKKIGIAASDKAVVEGISLENMTDEQLQKIVGRVSVFARVSPKHKLRIVDALQAQGEIVAMLGDGVNDAPALKSANIGVAVNSGTDVAKEVADLVLLDNGFHTIVKAIEQGRVIFSNIRKVFIYLVADDFAELFIFLTSMIIGLPLPLLPAQILWINIIEDGLPDLALTTEQELSYVMREPPRKHGEPILTKPLKLWLTAIFFTSGSAALLLFYGGLKLNMDLDSVRTMTFALMGLDSLIFAFCVRSFRRTIFRRDIFSNRYLVLAVLVSFGLLLMAIYAPFMHNLLSTVPLSMNQWLAVLTVCTVEIALIEFYKKSLITKTA